MKKILFSLVWVLAACGCTGTQPAATTDASNRAARIVAEIHNPHSKQVLVASHRGDWRNYPENSVAAIESAIRMGVDIVEIDLALTADSVLVICHDRTLDRTTSGRGRIANVTLDSVRHCRLKTGHGVVTEYTVPTLHEMLEACRDKAVVNIDKGYQYYDLALAVAEELGVTEQLLIKGKYPAEVVEAKYADHPHNMMYMPIIDILKPQGEKLFAEYIDNGIVPLAYEICWDEYTPAVENCMKQVIATGSKLWVNTLWPSLNGGLCDDAAFEGDPDAIYGPLIDMGATMIQSDRPAFLIDYLRSRGLHD